MSKGGVNYHPKNLTKLSGGKKENNKKNKAEGKWQFAKRAGTRIRPGE